MTENFITKKLNDYIDRAYDLSVEEQQQAMQFIMMTTKSHIERLNALLESAQETNDILFNKIEEMKDDIQHYQDFINDSNLGKQYAFYSKCKGVI